jgi:hypothetical protein
MQHRNIASHTSARRGKGLNRLLSTVALGAFFAVTMFGTANASVASGFSDGPYASTSRDSGTCGNDWAIDLFNRNFTATLPINGDGTYTVKETFTKGHFNTIAGQSPAACDGTYINHGAAIAEGVSGKMGGSFTVIVSNGVFDSNGVCVRNPDGQCTTAGWVAGFFGPDATYNVPQFNFTYTAKHQGLQFRSWTNADAGNSGDIATS